MFRKQNKNIPLFNIHINNVNIESVQNFNFLGLHLSSDMTWNFHINEVSKKISRNIGILKKLQLIVPYHILLTIYNTLILPHINYCLLSWGSKPDKIFQLRKRAVRAISGANSKSHTEPLFKFYNILKVDDIFTYKLLTFYWKAKQAQLPKYLSKFLPELSEGANKYAIRHPRLQPLVHKHEYIKGTCRYQLAMLLNEISVSDNSLGQLKIVTINVQIMTLFGLKRNCEVLSSAKLFVLLCNPKLLCLSAFCQLSCLINVMFIMYYNVNFRINVSYVFSICYIFLMKLLVIIV